MTQENQVLPDVAALLNHAGLRGIPEMTPVKGGRNNRGFAVRVGEKRYFVKEYYRSAGGRDRLDSEYRFCDFAWGHGLRMVPRPLARDDAGSLGLYEFIEGRRMEQHEVDARGVADAVAFIVALNEKRGTPEAETLPDAAEACFSVVAHLSCVQGRIDRLKAHADSQPELGRLVVELDRKWTRACNALGETLAGDVVASELAQSARCLSPSDFGFHNALLEHGNRVRFLDFEYAGWDDPAKTVCDLFCQPELPVPQDALPVFVETMEEISGMVGALAVRVAGLMPAYRIKWCCIMLNEFIPSDAARRQFSGVSDLQDRRDRQLERVAAILSSRN